MRRCTRDGGAPGRARPGSSDLRKIGPPSRMGRDARTGTSGAAAGRRETCGGSHQQRPACGIMRAIRARWTLPPFSDRIGRDFGSNLGVAMRTRARSVGADSGRYRPVRRRAGLRSSRWPSGRPSGPRRKRRRAPPSRPPRRPPKKAVKKAAAPDAVDLNTATPEQLAKLGLDEATTKKLVDSRPFTSLDDAKLKEAIPAETLTKLEGKVTVKPAVAPAAEPAGAPPAEQRGRAPATPPGQ